MQCEADQIESSYSPRSRSRSCTRAAMHQCTRRKRDDSPPPEEMCDDGQVPHSSNSLCGILSNDETLRRHLRRDAPDLSEASRPTGIRDEDMERHPGVLSCGNRSCDAAQMPLGAVCASGRSALAEPVRSSLL